MRSLPAGRLAIGFPAENHYRAAQMHTVQEPGLRTSPRLNPPSMRRSRAWIR